MNILYKERETLNRLQPGLDDELKKYPLEMLESADKSPALQLYRKHSGPALLVPKELGGIGATPLEMVHIQRALGSRSPSLAIATNMHSCTVAAVPPCESTNDLLRAIASDRLFLSSGFSDGESGKSILNPTMRIERGAGGVVVK